MPIDRAAPAEPALRLPALLSRGLEAAWKGGLLPPVLQSGPLIDWATSREGARPADGSWREALDILTEDLRHHAALNPLGRTIAHGQLTGNLRERIRAEAPSLVSHQQRVQSDGVDPRWVGRGCRCCRRATRL